MKELILEAVLDGLKDGALSIPVLFIAYLLMEFLERSKKLDEDMLNRYSRKAGPAVGGLLGIIPQCGISGAAATLFSTGAISVGTMLAVFFSTSDEMLPIMLSSLGKGIGIADLTGILALKVVAAVILGYAADAVCSRWFRTRKDIHSFCEREHCECGEEEGSPFLSALRHTLKIALILIAVTILLNLVLGLVGADRLAGTVINRPVAGELILALFGLIPNCSISVILTESYLTGIIGLGGLFSGLLSNAGIGLLVLFRNNRNIRENLIVTGLMAGFSFVTGLLISAAASLL